MAVYNPIYAFWGGSRYFFPSSPRPVQLWGTNQLGLFHLTQSGCRMNLPTHLKPAPRFKERIVLYPHILYVFKARCLGAGAPEVKLLCGTEKCYRETILMNGGYKKCWLVWKQAEYYYLWYHGSHSLWFCRDTVKGVLRYVYRHVCGECEEEAHLHFSLLLQVKVPQFVHMCSVYYNKAAANPKFRTFPLLPSVCVCRLAASFCFRFLKMWLFFQSD